ncbi:MAG: 23S rRNA (adenine(2503)-C(2))-methyltransferase RlmN [Dehalococcoidia bacterium]|nr:MAG: 23S rRNA (adenine(2503)-C(2))-methyltransferase RlmN [Dehalococcoidia bacterium]
MPLLGRDTSELRALLQKEGAPAYRGGQLAEWLYRRRALTFDEMSNLPGALRTRLQDKYEVGRSRLVTACHSQDGTVKLLLELRDGARIETVGLPYADRFSGCLSTQVGCPVGCVFCATGQGGFTRNLTAGEIVDQALAIQAEGSDRRLDHVIFMGMGEPLLNYEAVMKAARLLNNEVGVAMRHITLSTGGIVPGILRLAEEKSQLGLAVSLHAPADNLRRRIVPNAKWPVAEVIAACHQYIRLTGRRVTFEYCLLGGVNDDLEQARQLAALLHGLNCHVNLIPYNSSGTARFREPSLESIRAFRRALANLGIQVTQRLRRGRDIEAACGQLRQRIDKETRL